MKKARLIVSLVLLILLCSSLSSCFLFGPPSPWEEDKLRDTFFPADYLAERGVEDFPVPKLEGSYFDAEKNILYLNLSRQDFDAYVDDVVDYLRQKEAFPVKGFQCDSDIGGVFLLLYRYPLLASIEVENISYPLENTRIFGFSTKGFGDMYDGRLDVEGAKFVSLTWEPTTKDSGAAYTAVMEFPHHYQSKFLVCYHGHEFEEVTYPVPGTVFTTTIRTCTRCGEKESEGYGYGNELTEFSWTVVEGTAYLTSSVHALRYRGSLVQIPVKISDGVNLKMTANGTDIPLFEKDGEEAFFAFIMPYGNVEIVIEAIEHVHTGEVHSGEVAHWYTYTCGCPSNEIAELHYDHNEDGICDACDYVMQVQP